MTVQTMQNCISATFNYTARKLLEWIQAGI